MQVRICSGHVCLIPHTVTMKKKGRGAKMVKEYTAISGKLHKKMSEGSGGE